MSATVSRGTLVIDVEACKGCDLCIDACPPRVLVMTDTDRNERGYRYPQLLPGCTGCKACSQICPDFVFQVYKYDEPLVEGAGIGALVACGLAAVAGFRRHAWRRIGLATLRALVFQRLARTFFRIALVAFLQLADGVVAVGRGGVRLRILASGGDVHRASSCSAIDRYAQHPRAVSRPRQGRRARNPVAGAVSATRRACG